MTNIELEKYGVDVMSKNEMQEVSGGFWPIVLFLVSYGVGYLLAGGEL